MVWLKCGVEISRECVKQARMDVKEKHLLGISRKRVRKKKNCTNLEIQPEDARLAPNIMVRGLALKFKEAKIREWEAAEREWRESVEGKEGKTETYRDV